MTRLYPWVAYVRIAFAASSTTNLLSETAMSRLYLDFSRLRASNLDCVNARSFVALGATRATLIGLIDPAPVEAVPPLELVVLLLPHAAAMNRTAVATTSNLVRRSVCSLIVSLLLS